MLSPPRLSYFQIPVETFTDPYFPSGRPIVSRKAPFVKRPGEKSPFIYTCTGVGVRASRSFTFCPPAAKHSLPPQRGRGTAEAVEGATCFRCERPFRRFAPPPPLGRQTNRNLVLVLRENAQKTSRSCACGTTSRASVRLIFPLFTALFSTF